MKVNVFFFYADTAFPNQSVYQKHCKGMAVKMRRTNRETSKWLKMISLKNLTMWANFEEAKTFFGSFPGDHKTFGPWKQSFLRKEKKIKNEAQQRLMKELGGSGKQ